MIDRCLTALRAKITELQQLLEQSNLPEDKILPITQKLDSMLAAVTQHEQSTNQNTPESPSPRTKSIR